MGLPSPLSKFDDYSSQQLANVYIESSSNQESPTSKLAFQYWPESFTDSQGGEYATKNIPGGSLPIYQWVSMTERTIAFTSYFTRDESGKISLKAGVMGGSVPQNKYNVDINGAVAWLRSLQYPFYDSQNKANPPLIITLYMPGVVLSAEGLESIECVLTQVDVTWMKFFPNGQPRIATADLSFSEVAQSPEGGVVFSGRDSWQKIIEGTSMTDLPGAYSVAPNAQGSGK